MSGADASERAYVRDQRVSSPVGARSIGLRLSVTD